MQLLKSQQSIRAKIQKRIDDLHISQQPPSELQGMQHYIQQLPDSMYFDAGIDRSQI